MIFGGLRAPLLSERNLPRGWNSDTAIRGLMANRILDGKRFDVFFWGQNYMGPMTSLVAAGVGVIRRTAGLQPKIGPEGVRLASLIEVALGIVFFAFGLRRIFGGRAALLAALVGAISPPFLFRESVLPNGPEMVLFLGGILFWQSARIVTRPGGFAGASPAETALFGLVTGIGWWMNPGVLFVPLSVLYCVVSGSGVWERFRFRLRLRDRFWVRPGGLGWAPMKPVVRALIRFVNVVLSLEFVHALAHGVGLESQLGFRLPLPFLFWPLAEPVILFFASQVVVSAAYGSKSVPSLLEPMSPERRRLDLAILRRGGFFAGALALGAAPVWLGGILGWYAKTYSYALGPIPSGAIPERWTSFWLADLWSFLGADKTPWGWAFGAASAAFAAGLAVKNRGAVSRWLRFEPGSYSPGSLAAGTIFFAFVFHLFSSTSAPGQFRYLTAALLPAYGVLAAVGLDFDAWLRSSPRWKLARMGLPVVFVSAAACLGLGSLGERNRIASESDPSPVLDTIRGGGYEICYADYWQAYQLQFLGDESVRFIPYLSRDRNPEETRELAGRPGRRCFVDAKGNVSEMTSPPQKRRTKS